MSALVPIDQILANGDIAGPASDEAIRRAEQSLGVEFPPSYREFLRRYGAVGLYGCEFAGLFIHRDKSRPPLWTDVLKETLKIRLASRGAIPKEYIFLTSDGTDYYFYLDTSSPDPSGECPVIVLGPGVDRVVVAGDFNEFVVRTVNRTICY